MMFLGHDWTFWVALVGATVVRIITSPFHSWARSVTMVFTSIIVAWIFTDAVVAYLHLDPVVYKAPVGGLLALTADGLVRVLMNVAANPAAAFAAWRRLRGGETSKGEEGTRENGNGEKP